MRAHKNSTWKKFPAFVNVQYLKSGTKYLGIIKISFWKLLNRWRINCIITAIEKGEKESTKTVAWVLTYRFSFHLSLICNTGIFVILCDSASTVFDIIGLSTSWLCPLNVMGDVTDLCTPVLLTGKKTCRWNCLNVIEWERG